MASLVSFQRFEHFTLLAQKLIGKRSPFLTNSETGKGEKSETRLKPALNPG